MFSFLGVFCCAAIKNTSFLGVPGLGLVELGAQLYTHSQQKRQTRHKASLLVCGWHCVPQMFSRPSIDSHDGKVRFVYEVDSQSYTHAVCRAYMWAVGIVCSHDAIWTYDTPEYLHVAGARA